MKYITPYNESVKKSDLLNFLNDFGFFITLNLSKIQQFTIDEKANVEIGLMLKRLREPLINGKNYTEILGDINTYIKEPILASKLILQIKLLLEYIEPRILKLIKDCEQKVGWIQRINKLKEEYKKVIS